MEQSGGGQIQTEVFLAPGPSFPYQQTCFSPQRVMPCALTESHWSSCSCERPGSLLGLSADLGTQT